LILENLIIRKGVFQMSNVKNITNTFSRIKENNAKYGYYPTPLEVVRMEMELIGFNGVSPTKQIPVCDLTGGEGDQLYEMYKFLHLQNLEPVAYYNEITRTRYNEAIGKYEGLPNFHFCNSDLFRLKCRNKDGRRYDTKTMIIVRNNPPYGDTERLGERIRMEELFFMENDRYLVDGGIHIFELPITTLILNPSFMRKITYRYENINIYKLPKDVFPKFKQVVLVGVRKKENTNDHAVADEWIEKLKADNIQYLDEVQKPMYCITDEVVNRAKTVNVYRDGEVNDITFTNGLFNELDDLFKKEKEEDLLNKRIEVIQDEVAIIERSIGHRALELASGKFNRVCGNVLIFGYTDKKVIKSVEIEGDKEVTTETEIIVSGIEVTNKNGDVIKKES
jgi:hypothetical protein